MIKIKQSHIGLISGFGLPPETEGEYWDNCEVPSTHFPGTLHASWNTTVGRGKYVAFRHTELRDALPQLGALDCTLEMRQPGWAHFAGKGLQSEAKAILAEVPADGC